MSETVSLLISAGQAFVPQCARAPVPAAFSAPVLKPSQSGSLAGTGQGGMDCAGFDQLGQLYVAFSTPSQSKSPAPGAHIRPKNEVIFVTSVMSKKPSE